MEPEEELYRSNTDEWMRDAVVNDPPDMLEH